MLSANIVKNIIECNFSIIQYKYFQTQYKLAD